MFRHQAFLTGVTRGLKVSGSRRAARSWEALNFGGQPAVAGVPEEVVTAVERWTLGPGPAGCVVRRLSR